MAGTKDVDKDQIKKYSVVGNLAKDLLKKDYKFDDFSTPLDIKDPSVLKIKFTEKLLDQKYNGGGNLSVAYKIGGGATLNMNIHDTKTLRASCVMELNPFHSIGAAITTTNLRQEENKRRATYFTVGSNSMIDESTMLKLRYRSDGKVTMIFQHDQVTFSAKRLKNHYRIGVSLNFKEWND